MTRHTPQYFFGVPREPQHAQTGRTLLILGCDGFGLNGHASPPLLDRRTAEVRPRLLCGHRTQRQRGCHEFTHRVPCGLLYVPRACSESMARQQGEDRILEEGGEGFSLQLRQRTRTYRSRSASRVPNATSPHRSIRASKMGRNALMALVIAEI